AATTVLMLADDTVANTKPQSNTLSFYELCPIFLLHYSLIFSSGTLAFLIFPTSRYAKPNNTRAVTTTYANNHHGNALLNVSVAAELATVYRIFLVACLSACLPVFVFVLN